MVCWRSSTVIAGGKGIEAMRRDLSFPETAERYYVARAVVFAEHVQGGSGELEDRACGICRGRRGSGGAARRRNQMYDSNSLIF